MRKLLNKLKTTFKKINIKSKKTWAFFGVIGIGIIISTILLSYGYYINTGTKQVIVSGTAITRASDLTLQIYLQDRDSSGNAISNSYSRSYYIPTNNYTYESAKTVCGTGITLTYDSTNHQFRLESTQRGVCKVYFAADGTVIPNATFNIYVEQTMNGGNYRQVGSLPDNDYIYTINTTRTSCTDPNAEISIVNRKIEVTTSMDLDCTIYVDIQSLTGGGISSIATYLENNNPAGYRGSSYTDSATQNLYRYTGAYQASDAEYATNVDNYICLGSSAQTCPDDNIYRIIGVVAEDDATTGLEAGMIKVIKNTSLGEYTWDGGTGASDTNKNVNSSNYRSTWTCTSSNYTSGSSCFPGWHQSYLNTGILNTTYLNSISSFSNKIASVKWHCYVGSSTPTAASEYSASLCSDTPSKISIIYAGDYLNAYNNGTNNSSDSYIPWMQINNNCSNSGSGNDYKYACGSWTMANYGFRYDSSSSYYWLAWYVYSYGGFGGNLYFYYGNGSLLSYGYALRPVFYLNKNVKLVSGNGTYDSPFRTS